jgi:hypothetical protein
MAIPELSGKVLSSQTSEKPSPIVPTFTGNSFNKPESLMTMQKVHLLAMGTMGTLGAILLGAGLFTLLGLAVTLPLGIPILLLIGGAVFAVNTGIQGAKAKEVFLNQETSLGISIDAYESGLPDLKTEIHADATPNSFGLDHPGNQMESQQKAISNTVPLNVGMKDPHFNSRNARIKSQKSDNISITKEMREDKYKIYIEKLNAIISTLQKAELTKDEREQLIEKQKDLMNILNENYPKLAQATIHGFGFAALKIKEIAEIDEEIVDLKKKNLDLDRKIWRLDREIKSETTSQERKGQICKERTEVVQEQKKCENRQAALLKSERKSFTTSSKKVVSASPQLNTPVPSDVSNPVPFIEAPKTKAPVAKAASVSSQLGTPTLVSSEEKAKKIPLKIRLDNVRIGSRRQEWLDEGKTEAEKYKIYNKLIGNIDLVISHPHATNDLQEKYKARKEQLIEQRDKDCPNFKTELASS